MLNADQIIALHDGTNRAWHLDETFQGPGNQLTMFVLLQHRANFDLWHEEDKARNPTATNAAIAAVKHNIDEHNQERNDYVEQIDTLLMNEAAPQNEQTPLHSETPGLIIDRLSILSLKIHHTAEQTERASASEDHRARNLDRLHILTQQRADLAACLDRPLGTGSPRRTPLQALPPAEDVQRPRTQSRGLRRGILSTS